MKLIVMSFLLVSSVANLNAEQVCLLIDQEDSGHHKFPNIATDAQNPNHFIKVYHKKEACFDLNKRYYMQHFLEESNQTPIYRTRCTYEPHEADDEKLLLFQGENRDDKCPVVDEFHID